MSDWWKTEIVYQIYPRSFQDTNNDGIGDLPGILSRLPEIKRLGVGILWLSPVYASPNDDNGYDISDYRSIHPDFGTLEDMDRLIAEARRLDLRIVMDLVINHTSDEHEWFRKSRDPQSPYRDYYIWKPGVGDGPPNNWTSFFAEDCWEFDPASGEYYLHLFSRKQPDLNYRNPAVLREVEEIMRFWLEKGISGFRCDVINVLFKDSLDDGKKKLILTGSEHYISREGTHEILRTLRRDVLSRYDCFAVGETVFVTPQMGRDLCEPSRGELDMIFSFEHMETDQYIVKWFRRRFSPRRLAKVIARWQGELTWNANYFENHDQPRSVSRFGDDSLYRSASAKMLCVFLLSLRGTPFLYQGQELGMTNFDYESMDELRDIESRNVDKMLKRLHFPSGIRWRMMQKSSRDNARTPYPWTAGKEAGFTDGTPWIGINKNYSEINYDMEDRDPDSVLASYRRMIRFRAESPILLTGSFRLLRATNRSVIFERSLGGERRVTVLLNFTKRTIRPGNFAGKVLLSTAGTAEWTGRLLPYEAVILGGDDA